VPETTWVHDKVVSTVSASADSANEAGLFKRLEKAMAAEAMSQGHTNFHLDKIALARSAVAILDRETTPGVTSEDVAAARRNFAMLLSILSRAARDALRLQVSGAMAARLKRTRREFVATHRSEARKEDVLLLLEDMTIQIESDSTKEANDVRARMREITREFDLTNNSRELVDDHASLVGALNRLAL